MRFFVFLLTALACNAASKAGEPDACALTRLTTDGLLKQRPAWSPDGQQLVFARHQGTTIFLYIRSADGSQRRLTQNDLPEYDAVWSPDGTRLAFAFDKASPNQGDIDVHTIGTDGSDAKPVATSAGKLSHEEWPSWSPDGKWLALSSTRDDNQELYVIRPDGNDMRRLTNDPAIDAHPAWSPDGQHIAFATNRWGDLELALITPDGGDVVRLTESVGLDDYPTWSPDGRHLAFTSNRDGNLEIYVMDIVDKRVQNATRHAGIDNFPAWTPDGRLTFVSNRDGGLDIYVFAQ